jgi:hypothetical protein
MNRKGSDADKGGQGSLPPSTARVPDGDDYREEMPTYTDPVELEAARIKSTFSSPPPAMPLPPEAQRMAAYERIFGGFDRILSIALSAEDVAAASLDGRAGMLLGFLDGRMSIRMVLALGILEAADTLAVLEQLLDRGVIILK